MDEKGTSRPPADTPAAEPVGSDGQATPEPPQLPKQVTHAKTPRSASSYKPPKFIFDPLAPYKGAVRRFFIAYKHVLGLLAGGFVAYVRALPAHRKKRLRSPGVRLAAFFVKPFVKRELVNLPFPVQLRRRLEILGPTFIKLGQIMAIREDVLPPAVTSELKQLFDRLPAIPFATVREIIEDSLDAPVDVLFAAIDDVPLGSASIAQAHRAETRDGKDVVVKVIKPGIRDAVVADLKLLQAVGRFLQWILPRYQPRRIIDEFSSYTLREIDYTYEADNGEVFAAHFRDLPDVVFPTMYRSLSTENVLTMAYLDGFSPGSPEAVLLTDEERRRVIDLGAAAIIRMLYQDGFFHADLHAGNLKILRHGDGTVQVGFIDVGMVGRFEEATRRRMLYYFHALVTGDVDAATRYLTDMAQVGEGGDPKGFRRAVADLCRRFILHGTKGDLSMAQLILQSVGLAGKYRLVFPVEMTLMVKALVTFEGVGRMLDPDLDVAAASRRHVGRVFRHHFNPEAVTQRLMSSAPEMVDLLTETPHLLAAGFKTLEDSLAQHHTKNPLAGLRSSIIAGSCIIGGVLALVQGTPIVVWITLFVIGLLLAVLGK